MKRPRSGSGSTTTVFLVGLVALSTVAAGGVGAQSTELPDDITIETVNGEDADQVNDVEFDGPREFDVTVGGVDEFGDRFTWRFLIDGEPVSEAEADAPTVTVRLTPDDLEKLEEGAEHTLEVRLINRDEHVAADTTVRFHNIDDATDSPSSTLPDEISIETVNGQVAEQVNDVELVDGGEFETTISGVDEFQDGFSWKIFIDGEPVREAEANDPTVRVHLDEELANLEEGTAHTLEIRLVYHDEYVAADTTVRFSNLGEIQSERGPPLTSEIFTLRSPATGIPSEPEPTQEMTLDGQFEDGVEPTDVTLSVQMIGGDRLPPGMEVTSVTAESDAWPVRATPTDDGFELEVQGAGGPESGEIHVTIEFDATSVYDEQLEVQRDITYLIEDPAGDASGRIDSRLWEVPFYVVVETPQGERLTPDTERENWQAYYSKRSPPFDPGIDVFIGDGKRVNTSRSPPTADGVWQMGHRPGHYLRVKVDGYADPVLPTDEIEPNEHLERDNPYVVELSEGSELAVALSDQHGDPLPDGFLELTDENGIKYKLTADNDGVVRAQLAPGEYTGAATAYTTLPKSDIALAVTEGERTETSYSLVAPEVISGSVEHVGGTEPDVDSIEVDSIYYQGAMIVSLKPEDADPVTREQVDEFGVDKDPHDIADLGVDETTELRITLELDSFEPDSLFWAARDANWDVVESGEETTVVEIETKATGIQKLNETRTGFGDATTIDWPSGEEDVADVEYDSVVEVWLWDFDQLSEEAGDMSGISVMTNAQVFSAPEMEGGELSIYMAAPARTVDGDDHSGYYQAYLSDELLEEWNVEDPEADLQVTWDGESEEFDVQPTEDGVYLEVEPVHYSDGRMSVKSQTYEPDTKFLGLVPTTLPVYVLGVGALVIVLVLVGIVRLVKR